MAWGGVAGVKRTQKGLTGHGAAGNQAEAARWAVRWRVDALVRTWLGPRAAMSPAPGSTHTVTPCTSNVAASSPPPGPGASDRASASADWKWWELQMKGQRPGQARQGVKPGREQQRLPSLCRNPPPLARQVRKRQRRPGPTSCTTGV